MALMGAQAFNVYDKAVNDSRTWLNQPNHDEAIIRGYLGSAIGVVKPNNSERDQRVNIEMNTRSLGHIIQNLFQ